uniref:Uncharacterized protein n=1 Tax=Oryza barthii TaxID=65489 RepID=A0A0D3GLK8_9ORYZ
MDSDLFFSFPSRHDLGEDLGGDEGVGSYMKAVNLLYMRAMFGMTALSVPCPFVGLVSGLWASSIALTDDDDDDDN